MNRGLGANITSGLQVASPLLLAMGQNLLTPPQQRDPRTTQIGLAAMMQQAEQRRARDEAEQARKTYQQSLGNIQGVPPELIGVLRGMDPDRGRATLAQLMTQQGAAPSRYRVGDQLVDADGNVVYSATAPQEPAFRRATPDEAAQYGATAGQFGPDGRFYPISQPSGTNIEVGPDGQMRFTQGPGVQQKPFTEGQSKDNVYVVRARGALQALEPVAERLTSITDRALDADPTGVLRGEFQNPEFQLARQAADEFLQAILRKDTGAAITSQEQELYGETYLPRPGDGPEVLAQKAQARRRAIAAIQSGMSPAQMLAVEQGLVGTPRESQGALDQPPEGVDPADWEFMSPEDRALFGGSGAGNPSAPAAAGLVDKISFVESGGDPNARNPRSSATGAGQFIDQTWIDMIRRHRPDLAQGRSREQLLELRRDQNLSREMIERYASDNAAALRARGLPTDEGAIYLAHFAGPGGAVKALTANPIAPIEEILGRAAIAANPFLQGKTAGWLVDWARRKMNDRANS